MKLKKLFALSLSVLSMNTAYAMSDKDFSVALRKDISKYIFSVKAPRLMFHWTDASDITPQGKYNQSFPGDFQSFKDFVVKQGAKIYRARSATDRDIEGPGLYLASDPFYTRRYGGEKNFGLIVGVLKPGAKVLPNNRQLYIAQDLTAEIQARGCTFVSTYAQLLDTIKQECTKIKQLLVGQDISFVDGRMYQYGTSYVPGCNGARSAYKELTVPSSSIAAYQGLDTFVAYNANLFSEIIGITHKTVAGKHQLTNQVLSYLKGMQKNMAMQAVVSMDQLNDPSIKAMTEGEIEKFSQQYIMGCNM